jgi:ATP-dependent DNA ligase
MKRRAELVGELAPYVTDGEHPWSPEQLPGAISKWSATKDHSFVALRPELVVEVAYDHMEGARFRHTAQFRRWRPDRTPESCTYGQLERPISYDLDDILAR